MAGTPRRSDRFQASASAPVMAAVLAGLTVLSCLEPHSVRAAEKARVATGPELIREVNHRQTELRRMGVAMRVIGRFLKGEGANVGDVGASAEVIRAIAGELSHELFPEGTAIGVGRSTARPEIWQEWDIFRERARALETAATRLIAASATGNVEAVREPIVAVGQACGACHELFRRKLP